MTRLTLVFLIALGFAVGWMTAAKAQSWTETVTYTDSSGKVHFCTITYTNGGRQRYVVCTP